MLLPEPVGATDKTSRPASIAATTSDCPGLKASRPKTSFRVRSALSIISPESDGIPPPHQRLLTGRICPARDERTTRPAAAHRRRVAGSGVVDSRGLVDS